MNIEKAGVALFYIGLGFVLSVFFNLILLVMLVTNNFVKIFTIFMINTFVTVAFVSVYYVVKYWAENQIQRDENLSPKQISDDKKLVNFQ